MSNSDESIYSLIPKPRVVQKKEEMFRSKFSSSVIPPTASTFGGGSYNLAGDVDAVATKQEAALFGKSVRASVNPSQYQRKQSKELPDPERFDRGFDPSLKKPALPKKSDRPVYGLQTQKNFIITNAIDTILAEPSKKEVRAPRYTEKEDYGQVPQYLHEIKQQIADELDQIKAQESAELDEARPNQMRQLSEEERLSLLGALKKKWEKVNVEYQGMTHNVVLDTIGKIRRKEQYETELAQLEKDIQKVDKKFVYVVDDN